MRCFNCNREMIPKTEDVFRDGKKWQLSYHYCGSCNVKEYESAQVKNEYRVPIRRKMELDLSDVQVDTGTGT